MTYPLKEGRFSFKHFVTAPASGGLRWSCRETKPQPRGRGVCISPFEAHLRSLHVAAASCQIPALDRKLGAKKLLPTLIWSVHWQEQEEPFRIPTPFCFLPQSGGIDWVRGS
jgi:hypothetical protein